jgi:16S rRNA (uracil1498-N3)-methyltransferase
MEERYFYVPPDLIYKNKVIIEGDEYYHLHKVLRKKKGDVIHVVDGEGNDYVVKIEKIEKSRIHGIILEKLERPNETKNFFALGISVLKNRDKMDMIFEKGTELGVRCFYPIISERTIPNPKGLKIDRWRKIVLNAMKQSRRSILPYISEPISLKEFFKEVKDFDVKVLLDEEGENSFYKIKEGNKFLIVVGPEGSFTKDEKEEFEKEGFLRVKMGKRIMKSETASLIGLGILMFFKKEI